MDYKVLVIVYVPAIEQIYEMYIPINRTVSQVLVLINKLVNSLTSDVYPIKDSLNLYNRRTFKSYGYNEVIRNTDIRNGTELVLE